MTKAIREAIHKTFQRIGAQGGRTAAANMTPEQRKARARKAGKAGAKARWGKK